MLNVENLDWFERFCGVRNVPKERVAYVPHVWLGAFVIFFEGQGTEVVDVEVLV